MGYKSLAQIPAHRNGPVSYDVRPHRETIVTVHRLKTKTDDLNNWHVEKKIKPSERGAIKIARAYGNELLCVRYRDNHYGTERLTTVELVVERVVIQKRDDPLVSFKIKSDEIELQQLAQSKGAKYDRKNFMWKLARSEVLRMGLRSRIAVTIDQFYQEQVDT